MSTLSARLVNAYVEQTARQLAADFPEWSYSRDQRAGRHFVRQIVELCRAVGIHGESCVTRVARLTVSAGLALPLSPVLHDALESGGESEAECVRAFEIQLSLGTHELREITLATNIDGLAASGTGPDA